MARIDRRSVQNFDWVLAGVALFLLVIGLGNLYSATVAGTSGGFPAEMKRQLAALGLGMAALVVAVLVDYRHLERLAFPLYVATLVVLAATLVFAPVTRGSQAWLVFGPVRFQPSELAKVAMVVALASLP